MISSSSVSPLPAPSLPEAEPPAPPPISGGSVLVTTNQRYVVVGDSDRDRVWIVNGESMTLRHEVVLEQDDEPGRIAEDASGNVHVVLRRSGDIVSINPDSGAILARRFACGTPRGITVDRRNSWIVVVCAGGEFLQIPLDGSPIRTWMKEPDLRDVLVHPIAGYVVSTYRDARVIFIDGGLRTTRSLSLTEFAHSSRIVNSLSRMVFHSDGDLLLTARASIGAVSDRELREYYAGGGAGCSGVIDSVLMKLPLRADERFNPIVTQTNLMPLVTDVVEDQRLLWMISAANHGEVSSANDGGAQVGAPAGRCGFERVRAIPEGWTITGGAALGQNMVFFSRQPAALIRSDGRQLLLAGARNVEHTGHRLFHGNFNLRAGATCASCHSEGGDDGVTWTFPSGIGRTPSLRGTITGTAPYHWAGEFADFRALTRDLFITRMGGPELSDAHIDRLQQWVESLPPLTSVALNSTDHQAIIRGGAVFASPEAGCTRCHSGPRMTNNLSVNIGTGGMIQVPSLLGLRFRPPYMRSGCATTLERRFTDRNCGGAEHGGYHLPAEQLNDLLAYLRAL